MVTHIVMWKFKDENKLENVKKVKDGLEALVGVIDGLISAEVGIDVKLEADAFDAVLISKFENLEALQAYKVHPRHVAVSEFVRTIKVDRKVADFR